MFGGSCVVPLSTSAGSTFALGSCATSGATGYTLAPSANGSTVPTSQGKVTLGGLCLDAATGNVQLNDCGIDALTQEWTYTPGGLLQSVSNGACIVPTGSTAGSSVVLGACNGAVTPIGFNLMFVNGMVASYPYPGLYPQYVPPRLPPTAASNVQCLDTYLDLETVAGDTVDNFQCNATNAQWFHFDTSGRLLTPSGACVTAASAAIGAAVTVQPCGSSGTQQWLYSNSQLSSLLGSDFLPLYSLGVKDENPAPLTPTDLESFVLEGTPPPSETWLANMIWPANGLLTFTQASGEIFDPSADARGNMTVTIDNTGNITLTGSAQDEGWFDYNFLDTVYFDATDASGNHPALADSGTVRGRLSLFGNSTVQFEVTGNSPVIAANWYATTHGGVHFNQHFDANPLTVALDLLESTIDLPLVLVAQAGAKGRAQTPCVAPAGYNVGAGRECTSGN